MFPYDDDGYTSTVGILTKPGKDVAYGQMTVKNTGDRPATLVSAELLGDDESDLDGADKIATIKEVLVRDVTDHDTDLLGAGEWPHEDYGVGAVPLEDHVIDPGVELELLYIVTAHSRGRVHWPITKVTYRVGEKHYFNESTTGFRICADGRSCV